MATSTLATGMKSLEFEISVEDSVNNDMILYSAELIPAPWFIDGLKNTWAISRSWRINYTWLWFKDELSWRKRKQYSPNNEKTFRFDLCRNVPKCLVLWKKNVTLNPTVGLDWKFTKSLANILLDVRLKF